ncbi:carcinoembryonic antigen-related cell adhesion molecule 1-like [Phycodurus eques]|uniref:carcinoembryonic antigen-related cell adhesion molecule 1-like n=1 Tax=Phycodurus eques TaxID=693459 RepID=UPI002ACE69AA|nr:carcinoembryonic antigen-related cell adhesion molecule 1-like [Phycodurus eques]
MFPTQANVLVLLLVTGSTGAAERVRYPPATCAVRGSTVMLLCSFTPTHAVVRAVWCVNHLICHGTTPSVYDSAAPQRNNWRYFYLGDLQGNCTLQIHNVQEADNTTFRFRMEGQNAAGHFTGTTGVQVTVIDPERMKVTSSAPGPVSDGAAVTLSCASTCSFHGLAVRWHRDGRALPESGPALRLGPLAAGTSANYTCALAAAAARTMSPPFRLDVEQRRSEPEDADVAVTLGLAFGLAAALILVVGIVLFVVKRKRRPASRHDVKRAQSEHEQCEHAYNNTPPSPERGGADGPEVAQSAQEVSYAAVQFKPKAVSRSALAKEEEDVVYSSVTRSTA